MKTLFGRDATCDVRVDDPKVSHEHASLRWKDGTWELRDLGSVNGTFVGTRRLAAGERAQLEVGAVFSLANPSILFELVDDSPPVAATLHRATGKLLVATGGILVLPSEDQPRMTLFASSDGIWHVEVDQEVRAAKHGEELVLGAETYVVEVPTPTVGTARSGANSPMLESLRLKFAVAPDEESVEVTLFVGDKPTTLPPRRYHYLLVTLARAWLADIGIAPSVRGYRDRDELCDKLEVDVMKLNVEIYRLRKQFAELGVQGAAGLIERRPGTFEVRIGITNIEVVMG
jgi:hypothetical protein